MHLKSKPQIAAIALALSLSSTMATADSPAPPFDSIFYYRIGGAKSFHSAPRLEIETLDLSFKAGMSGLSCGGFDPLVTIEHTFNKVKNGAEQALVQLEGAASAAISALPGYILQKVDPGLYDLFTNTLLRAEQAFSLATKSCETMQQQIQNGENPFEDFITANLGDVWQGSVSLPGTNIEDVVEITSDPQVRDSGFTWVGGQKAGGDDMEPAWILSDTAAAGYNMMLNRQVDADYPPPQNGSTPPVARVFESPEKLKEWVRQVLGDVFVGICETCDEGMSPGMGLRPLLEDRKGGIEEKLQELYDGTTSPTLDNLAKASAPDVLITRQVIETLQQMSPYDANIYLSKMVDEIALSRVVNEALMVQQVLRTGRRESNISTIGSPVGEVQNAMDQIDQEINSLLREDTIKKRLVGETMQEVLIHGRNTEAVSRSRPGLSPQDQSPLRDGVVPN